MARNSKITSIEDVEKLLSSAYGAYSGAKYMSDVYDETTLVDTVGIPDKRNKELKVIYHIDPIVEVNSSSDLFKKENVGREYLCVKVSNPENKNVGDYTENMFGYILHILSKSKYFCFSNEGTDDNFDYFFNSEKKNQLSSLYKSDYFATHSTYYIISQNKEYTTILMIQDDYTFLVYSMKNCLFEDNSGESVVDAVLIDFYNQLNKRFGTSKNSGRGLSSIFSV